VDPLPGRHPLVRFRSLYLLIVGAAIALSLGWFAVQHAPRTVAIGFAAVSGNSEDIAAFHAVELAVAKLNTEAEGTGLHFEARQPPEFRNDPVYSASYLRSAPSVAGVVGPIWSQDMLDATPEYGERTGVSSAPVVAIAPIATNRDLSGISKWVFRLCPTDDAEATVAAHFAFDSLGSRRPVILFVNDAYGRDWSRAFSLNMQQAGGVVLARQPFPANHVDWPLYAEYVGNLHADLIVMPTVLGGMQRFISTLRNLGVSTPILAGDAAAGIRVVAQDLPAFHYVALFSRDRPANAVGTWFISEYERANPGKRAWQVPVFAFDAALTIGRAVIAVGPRRDRVRVFLEQLGGERPAIVGATGPIAFDSLHDGRFAGMRLEGNR
jgi:ABC-type branched-subunit amino acid transport system substrate-binding protein